MTRIKFDMSHAMARKSHSFGRYISISMCDETRWIKDLNASGVVGVESSTGGDRAHWITFGRINETFEKGERTKQRRCGDLQNEETNDENGKGRMRRTDEIKNEMHFVRFFVWLELCVILGYGKCVAASELRRRQDHPHKNRKGTKCSDGSQGAQFPNARRRMRRNSIWCYPIFGIYCVTKWNQKKLFYDERATLNCRRRRGVKMREKRKCANCETVCTEHLQNGASGRYL